MAVWRYVLLFWVNGSDIAHILKNDWSYMRCGIDEILSDKGGAGFNNKNPTSGYQSDRDHRCIEIFGDEKTINLFEC